MGVWRNDYEAVNGFDESFVGWGHEDADFALRLHNAGIKRKNGFFATEVYHLWHREANRNAESKNAATVKARMFNGQVLSTIGYRDCLGAPEVVIHRWG
jgi:predicted glycosyltransferase involved in capsule biosynthesis